METQKPIKQIKEESITIENGNKINLNIINNMIKIQIIFDSNDYLGIFALNFFQKDYQIFCLFGINGVKDFINQRIIKKEYSIIKENNKLKLILDINEEEKLKLIIPSNERLREISLEKLIILETEVFNLENKINEMKEELKNDLKKEIFEELNKKMNEKETKLNNIIRENINKELENKRAKILFYKKYEYISSILVEQKSLTEIPYYKHEFNTEQLFNIIQVNINIPYTFVKGSGLGKILVYLDKEMICDSSIHSENNIIVMTPLTVIGYCRDFPKGKHIIKILACVEGGILCIPYINPRGIEFTIKPEVSGSITVIGI